MNYLKIVLFPYPFSRWSHSTVLKKWAYGKAGIRNPEPEPKTESEPEPELKLRPKLGNTETSYRYPCGNKIQDGVLCYHCFEKFSAQWSWYQRYTHRAKELTFGYLVHACVLLYQTCLHITLRHFYYKKQTNNKIFSCKIHDFIKKRT